VKGEERRAALREGVMVVEQVKCGGNVMSAFKVLI